MGTESVKILLVEDQPADAGLVREMLAVDDAGRFDISHVTSMEAALALLARERFDALLLDLSLPDAQGLTAVTQLQREAPWLPIVVLSGLSDETIALKAVQAGAQDFLVKGWGEGRTLARALRHAIARKRSIEHLAHLASHDPLTDLPNRILFQERLARAVEHARRNRSLAALLLLDLDYFKNINDTFGHETGDRLLQAVGQRLKECVRGRDTVARLGGDEFAVILEDLTTTEDVVTVAEKMLRSVAQPFTLNGGGFSVNVSIGITLFSERDYDTERLVRYADSALYQAKTGGRDDYRFYQPGALERRPAKNC